MLELARYQRYRSKRGSELMGRGGRQSTQRRQTMLPRERKLRGREGRRHPRRFTCDAPRVDRGEPDSQKQRDPNPKLVQVGQAENRALDPGQWDMRKREQS